MSSTTETQAEKRARLRRMKILADSEKRLNRIVGGDSEPSTAGSSLPSSSSSTCDNHFPASDHLNNVPAQDDAAFLEFAQSDRLENPPPSVPTAAQAQVAAALPPRDNDPFPRKVSLISSPIHFKTLQLSKQYNSMLNHPNIINNLRCTSSVKFMFFLVLLSLISSYFNANIPMVFVSYQSIKQAYNGFYRNVWLDFNLTLLKELFTFIFSYVIVQVVIKVLST